MSLGKRIRELRTKRGFTQGQMAAKLEMTEANFSSYERDKSVPPSEKLNQIAQILDVSADYLLGLTNDPAPYEQFEPEVRTLARDIQDMESQDRELLKSLIKTMRQRAREAKKDK